MSGHGKRIIEILAAFQARKDMYVSPVSPEEAEKFLVGFEVGCFACGIPLNWTDIAARRGWENSVISPIVEMRSAGMSDDRIIDELISLRNDAAQQVRSA